MKKILMILLIIMPCLHAGKNNSKVMNKLDEHDKLFTEIVTTQLKEMQLKIDKLDQKQLKNINDTIATLQRNATTMEESIVEIEKKLTDQQELMQTYYAHINKTHEILASCLNVLKKIEQKHSVNNFNIDDSSSLEEQNIQKNDNN